MNLLALADRYCPAALRPYWERFRKSALAVRLARGAFWSLAGAAAARGLAFLLGILTARLLGKEGFGELGIIQSTVGMFAVFAGFGLGLTANKHTAEFRRSDPERAGRIIALSGVMSWGAGILAAAALLIFAPWLAERTLGAPQVAAPLRVAALLIHLGAVDGAQIGALAGFEAFRRIAGINLVVGLVTFSCVLAGAWLFGVLGAVWGYAIAAAVGCCLNRWAILREGRRYGVPIGFAGWHRELSVLWRFSLPSAAAGILVMPIHWLVQSLLVRQHGFAAQAEFVVGLQWNALATSLPMVLLGALLPVLSSIPPDQEARRRRVLWLGVALAAGITTVIALPIGLCASWVLKAYGRDFAGGDLLLRLMLLAAVLDAVGRVFWQTLSAIGCAWRRLLANGALAVMEIAAAWWLIPAHGAVGLAGALLLARVTHLLIQVPVTLQALRSAGARARSASHSGPSVPIPSPQEEGQSWN